MTKSQLKQIIKECIVEVLNESTEVDDIILMIRDYNRGKIKMDVLCKNILSKLGFKPDARNLNTVESHLSASSNENGVVPMDKYLIKDLYKLLK